MILSGLLHGLQEVMPTMNSSNGKSSNKNYDLSFLWKGINNNHLSPCRKPSGCRLDCCFGKKLAGQSPTQ